MRISLWSSPRNISTALMYSFAQRADTRVHDEPLYAHYLANTISNNGQKPIVLDSRILLEDPPEILRKLCDAIGLNFDSRMLRWDAGPRPEDGVWAPYWYQSIHQSTGFQPYVPKQTRSFPRHLKPLLAECNAIYDYLMSYSLN